MIFSLFSCPGLVSRRLISWLWPPVWEKKESVTADYFCVTTGTIRHNVQCTVPSPQHPLDCNTNGENGEGQRITILVGLVGLNVEVVIYYD